MSATAAYGRTGLGAGQSCATTNGGREVDARADDLFAVFEQAPTAVAAAVAIHRAMQAADWPDGNEVRLRIGLHRGRPTLTDTGYVGLSVHAAARICAAAHGGQIVLSSAVRSALPEDVTVRALGAWRFRGLPEPVELFQVEADDLLAEFPPLRSATASTSTRSKRLPSPAIPRAARSSWRTTLPMPAPRRHRSPTRRQPPR